MCTGFQFQSRFHETLTLIDVEQNIAATDYHALDGEILANVLRLAHLVVHLLWSRTRSFS